MSVAVLVPYEPSDCAWRTRAWRWVEERYRREHPAWDVIVAGCPGPVWSKGAAVAAARAQTAADVLVVADADSFVNTGQLRRAAEIAGDAPWVIPYETVRRLNSHVTHELLSWDDRASEPPLDSPLARRAYLGIRGGGIVVLRADAWDAAPLDPRFEGWGGEDVCWGWALDTLIGEGVRLDGELWHLWHPPALPGAKTNMTVSGDQLVRRYRSALGIPRLMRALIDDEMPAPREEFSPPRRYLSLLGPRTLRAAHQIVSFPGGVAEVTDSDVADVLDRTAGVAREPATASG